MEVGPWGLLRRRGGSIELIQLLGTDSPGGALLVGMDYTGGVSSMRNQAEEGTTLLARIVPAVADMHSVGAKAKAKEMEAKANDEEAWKAEVHVTEAGKADEAVSLGSSKSAMEDEEIGKETLQQLVKVMPNKFDILDPDGDDEKDERIDRGKSAIEKSARKAKAKANEEAGNRQKLIGNKTLQQLLKDMPNKFDILDPDGDDEKDEIDGGKSTIDEETVHAEEPMAPVPKDYFGLPPEYGEKVRKHNEKMKAEQEAMRARFEKLCQSKRSANSAGAGDSFIPAADPSATKSVGHYSVQDDLDYHDRGNSAAAQAKKKTAKKTTAAGMEMAHEAEIFDLHRTVWEFKHGKRCGSFSETTVLSSMQFTHYTPGLTPHSSFCCTPKTLQIFSIKLTRLDGGLKFPLSVYGVVAVRDMVDRNRNILFFRDFTDRQELKQDDPFLYLIGPSRAIVFQEKVCIEIELRVVAGSQDAKALITCAQRYSGGYGDGLHTICFKNRFCTLEVSSQPVKQTIQATILSVEVLDHKESAWPLEYGGLIACSPLSGKVVITDGRFSRNIDPPSSPRIVLVHSKHEAVPKGKGGFVHLWRQVVSVELQGRLDFDIKSYSKSGAIAAEASACFEPKVCNTSQQRCLLGDAEVTITVAWSRVATCKTGVALQHCARRCF
uniref:Uncharacterized protein n=1 Tax=Avena sativa TaxID=4498 RepID=A0ACD5ZAY0_AVESA